MYLLRSIIAERGKILNRKHYTSAKSVDKNNTSWFYTGGDERRSVNWIHELPGRRHLKINISELHLREGYRDPQDRVLATFVFFKDRPANSTASICVELLIAGAYLLLPDADFGLTYEVDRMNNSVTLKHPDTWGHEEADIFQHYLRIMARSNGWKVVTTRSPYGEEPHVLEETWS